MPTQTHTDRSNPSAARTAFETVDVPTETYLALCKPARIKRHLSIALSSQSYVPRLADLQSDWVAHVAVPAFKLFGQQRGNVPVGSFCSIGTGSGLDVLSAVEILGAQRVGLTDLHEEVVATAADNIARNHLPSHPLVIEAGFDQGRCGGHAQQDQQGKPNRTAHGSFYTLWPVKIKAH